jgi:uncharacterized protein
MNRLPLFLAAGIAALAPIAAHAAPVTDCPLRDAPYSIDSPLIDVLLNPQATVVFEGDKPGSVAKAPPQFMGTQPPTFAAILSVRQVMSFVGGELAALPAMDAKLRAIKVTAEDKIKRCGRYDNDLPRFAQPKGRPRLLLFEKINGFKDTPSVDAAHAALEAMARRKGWALVTTDKGGAFNSRTLARFDAVIWNNISGDVLTLAQRKAMQSFLTKGGGFVAVHGSAGDPAYFWDWYVDGLLGARFAGHPSDPQFQEARVVANPRHPLATAIPAEWRMKDEWYSFATNPRRIGANVLLTLDESTYKVAGQLAMGSDHPIAWTNCIGKGRMFYSAIGHLPETYSDPRYVALLEAAIPWAAAKERCVR